ncbi:Folate receptor alpha [Hondaea fermentalgiana]|uniref:Folate receptor alpha n=1 Tax=Hondaea fermentalgiana TaxID=2315210 RepID=A0A2R5G9A8_9STRA|nr:Folate receptor alpha [Hondaea fermentalgiana]|eukprot:GBG25063.1 Folate receptor alpha [Hondaea fermentalgiana]
MMSKMLAMVVAAVAVGAAQAETDTECKTFADIYTNGEGLCNNLFGGAFEYIPKTDSRYNVSYTMWFFSNDNPNDATTANRLALGLHDEDYSNTDVCHLQYDDYSHDVPQTDRQLPECHPWNDNSCCTPDIVQSPEYMREAYGAEFNWNRCQTLSQQCERFFVQEYCFYECDVNAGLFRKYAPHEDHTGNPDFNQWEMEKMPIQADYCDSWFEACQNDLFITCKDDDGEVSGNWFSCPSLTPEVEEEKEKLSTGAIVAIVVLSVAAFLAACWSCLLIRRERMGKPVFAPENFDKIGENGPEPTPSSVNGDRNVGLA